MTTAAGERFAIYHAPGGELWRRASAWLGRDAISGAEPPAPRRVGRITDRERRALTAGPRAYGLHATLKPPFHLAPGRAPPELLRAVADLAAAHRAIALPRLEVASLGSFLALRLSAAAPAVHALADACVRDLDRFRAPAPERELAGRRARGLSERQERYLREWGYPYVFEEYRFHVTLTSSIEDPERRERVRTALGGHLEDVLAAPHALEALTVFRQSGPTEPFVVLERFALGH